MDLRFSFRFPLFGASPWTNSNFYRKSRVFLAPETLPQILPKDKHDIRSSSCWDKTRFRSIQFFLVWYYLTFGYTSGKGFWIQELRPCWVLAQGLVIQDTKNSHGLNFGWSYHRDIQRIYSAHFELEHLVIPCLRIPPYEIKNCSQNPILRVD